MSTPSSSPSSPPPPASSALPPTPTGSPSASTTATCPRCARPIPANAALGACPHCLLAAGFASEPAAPDHATPPPSIAELAPEFPQLDLLELLGRGGMGAVYKARQKSLDRLVALKLLRPGLDADPSFAERFTREARALAQLNHPGIVTLYEFGRTPGGLFFILMEFVDGLNLRQLLAAGRLSPREALAIVPPLCDALQYAHDRGLIHRDIKPENILIDRLGRVKIADFGLAKLTTSPAPSEGRDGSPSPSAPPLTSDTGHCSPVIGHSNRGETAAGQIFGTPGYMAPEQRETPAAVDHRADIYALGVVLYQLLTGELPDTKQLQPPSHRVQLDIRLDAIVLRALEANSSLRYAAASELKTQLETISASPLPSAPPPGAPTSPSALSPSSSFPNSPAASVSNPSTPPLFRLSAIFSRPRLKFWLLRVAPITLLVMLALRFFVIAPYRIESSSVEPEIPAGSLALVYKLDRHFSPGDIIAYHHTESLTYVARVTAAGPVDGKLSITRRNQSPTPIPATAIIGKVVLNSRPSRGENLAPTNPPPTADTPRRFPNEPIRIQSDGTYAIGATQVSLGEIHQHFTTLGQQTPAPTLRIRAERNAAYPLIVALISEAKKRGVTKIAFDTRTDESDETTEPDPAAMSWLHGIDDGRYAESWQTASEAFRQNITESKWTETLTSVRTPLGSVLERRPISSQRVDKIPQKTGGPHHVLQFATRFEKFPPAIENVTFTRDTDGIWRASGYLIKPDLKAANPRDPATPVTSPIAGTVEKWLQQSDEARYAESWAATTPLFKQAMTEANWAKALQSVRAPLGKAVRRLLISAQQLDTLANVPGGPHQVLQFATVFENDSDTVETVTFTRDTDGTWRASGYFIKPGRKLEAPPKKNGASAKETPAASTIQTPANLHPLVSSLTTPRLQFREVLPQPTASTETLSFPHGNRSETLHLSTQILMDEKAVSDASIVRATPPSRDAISLHFSPTGAQQFAEITRTLVGKRLAVLFDGRVLIAPHIKESITGGSAQISGSFTSEELETLVKSLRDAIALSITPTRPNP